MKMSYEQSLNEFKYNPEKIATVLRTSSATSEGSREAFIAEKLVLEIDSYKLSTAGLDIIIDGVIRLRQLQQALEDAKRVGIECD